MLLILILLIMTKHSNHIRYTSLDYYYLPLERRTLSAKLIIFMCTESTDFPCPYECQYQSQNVHCQAANLEPKKEDIKVAFQLLQKLADKKDNNTTLMKLISAWTDIVSSGTTLVSGNKKLREHADDLEEYMKTESGLALLKAVVAQRKRLRAANDVLARLHSDWENGATDVSQGEGMGELLAMRMPESWESELVSESFDDALGQRAAAHTNSLEEAAKKFDSQVESHVQNKLLKADSQVPEGMKEMVKVPGEFAEIPGKLAKSGAHHWCQGVTSDMGLKVLADRADNTIQRWLPAAAILEFTNNF